SERASGASVAVDGDGDVAVQGRVDAAGEVAELRVPRRLDAPGGQVHHTVEDELARLQAIRDLGEAGSVLGRGRLERGAHVRALGQLDAEPDGDAVGDALGDVERRLAARQRCQGGE